MRSVLVMLEQTGRNRKPGHVRRLADEIKSLKRPPTMTEVRTLAQEMFGKTLSRSLFDLLKADWKKYGLEVVKGDSLAEKLIVPCDKG